jgi:hypothetical protein
MDSPVDLVTVCGWLTVALDLGELKTAVDVSSSH